tara:strand:- start:1072 stop:1299 length:228 start_codon:yes stop_codon:yes gene_type:complete
MGGLKIKEPQGKQSFNCQMCKKRYSLKPAYRTQSNQYVSDWIPAILNPVCRNCTYKENYGTKTYKKHMKEGSLDD